MLRIKAIKKRKGKGKQFGFLEKLHPGNSGSVDEAKKPSIEIITTATLSPQHSYCNYKSAFEQLDCMQVGHLDLRDRASANKEAVMQCIGKCDGVMFSGGIRHN